jgi:hypothetical protein
MKNNDEMLAVFNRSDSSRTISVPVRQNGEFSDILSVDPVSFKSIDKKVEIKLKPLSAIVLKKNN